jgi:hypothetical protein
MHWSWSLFAWGVGIGAAGVAGSYAIGRVARIAANLSSAYSRFVVLSIAVAVLAGALRLAWLDIAFAWYVAIGNFTVPLLLMRRLGPSTSAGCSATTSCGVSACATCPLMQT